ncbi:hypothetical protein [Streptomyces sp. NPDC002209]|uniref:hypothetical protein n=1 Tax=Streptomyces sp. NPDC002209 TaxID=3364638 RepID=UPI0036737C55
MKSWRPTAVSAHLIQGGAVWGPKGQQGVLDDVRITAGSPGAHCFAGFTQVSGITLPTEHRILPRTPEGQALAEPVLVSIDLSDITFA